MRSKYIKQAIDKLGPWYQRFEMDGQWTTDNMLTGEHVWPDIRSLMDEDLKGARILDIGSNAAYYSTMLALEGVDVIAVEPDTMYSKQAKWTQYYFESKHEKKLPITFIKKNVSDLNFRKIGRFDYILALSVIYFIGRQFGGKNSEKALIEQKRVVSEMCNVTDKVVLRTRNKILYNSIAYYNSIFLENEFYMLKRHKAKRPTVLYGRLINDGDNGEEE
ncbi:MAG: class I SAM-dependent methyltransferase [Candidatus Heimdallarchaeaceae archaeon]